MDLQVTSSSDPVVWSQFVSSGDRGQRLYEAESRAMQWAAHVDNTYDLMKAMDTLQWVRSLLRDHYGS